MLPALLMACLGSVHVAWACSCAYSSPEERRDRSDVVFVGRVIALQKEKQARRYTFEVSQVLKGSSRQRITVGSSGPGSACGSFFDQGTAYLIYAYGGADEFRTNVCQGNPPVDSPPGREEIAALRRPEDSAKP